MDTYLHPNIAPIYASHRTARGQHSCYLYVCWMYLGSAPAPAPYIHSVINKYINIESQRYFYFTHNKILRPVSAGRLLDRRYLDHHRRRCRRRRQHLILGTVATARAAVTCSRFFFYFCVLDKSHRLFHFSIAFQTTFKRPHLGGGTQGILPGLSASGRVDGGEAVGGLPRHGNDSFLALYSFRLLIHGPPRQRPR